MGVMGGAFFTTRFYGVEAHYYWIHTENSVTLWDVATGIIKAIFFGTAIGLISCHRGLNSRPGAEGVGRAATETFVVSFAVILLLDIFLSLFLISFSESLKATGVTQSLVK
jgi:phospholipid/cholesterol/gamma-HCH transport system permease protein